LNEPDARWQAPFLRAFCFGRPLGNGRKPGFLGFEVRGGYFHVRKLLWLRILSINKKMNKFEKKACVEIGIV
jgi:hypothetical protein